ncbi:MAG: hypothetical protein DWH99_08830 [Planctomycetota bacterium]|nr:MAG: hypothetical protein DWH99_08830 [Planctomycetota bacterium]
MTENFFDHDRLDVYRLSIEYVADAFDISRSLEGLHRHARDQWIVAMLTRMAMKFDGVSESSTEYNQSVDYEHDYEHEHEHESTPRLR